MGVAEAQIIVGGWSAGGHLAARLLEMPEVDAAFSISGIFDLEPLRHSYLQEKLGLSARKRKAIARSIGLGQPRNRFR